MQITYTGFKVAATSRTYSFRVTDGRAAPREFTVKVLLDSFRGPTLKFQDGPELCQARLKRALDGETADSPAKPHLSIEGQDTEEFLRRRYPRTRRAGEPSLAQKGLARRQRSW